MRVIWEIVWEVLFQLGLFSEMLMVVPGRWVAALWKVERLWTKRGLTKRQKKCKTKVQVELFSVVRLMLEGSSNGQAMENSAMENRKPCSLKFAREGCCACPRLTILSSAVCSESAFVPEHFCLKVPSRQNAINGKGCTKIINWMASEE